MYCDSSKCLDPIQYFRQTAGKAIGSCRVFVSLLSLLFPSMFPEAWDLLSESCASRLSFRYYLHCFEYGGSVPIVICHLLTFIVGVQ